MLDVLIICTSFLITISQSNALPWTPLGHNIGWNNSQKRNLKTFDKFFIIIYSSGIWNLKSMKMISDNKILLKETKNETDVSPVYLAVRKTRLLFKISGFLCKVSDFAYSFDFYFFFAFQSAFTLVWKIWVVSSSNISTGFTCIWYIEWCVYMWN